MDQIWIGRSSPTSHRAPCLPLLLLYLLGAGCLITASTAAEVFTPQDAKELLDKHNDYRREEFASDMYQMNWNMSLQERADTWARQCRFKHERNLDLGENLAFDTDHENKVFLRAMGLWHAEKSLWGYSKDACKGTCHFTQIVWSYTTSVGCSAHLCPVIAVQGNTYSNAMYLVCYYYPRGNFMGNYPYSKGAPCSECGEGDTCQDKLCVSEGAHSKLAPDFVKSLLPLKPIRPARLIPQRAAYMSLSRGFQHSSSRTHRTQNEVTFQKTRLSRNYHLHNRHNSRVNSSSPNHITRSSNTRTRERSNERKEKEQLSHSENRDIYRRRLSSHRRHRENRLTSRIDSNPERTVWNRENAVAGRSRERNIQEEVTRHNNNIQSRTATNTRHRQSHISNKIETGRDHNTGVNYMRKSSSSRFSERRKSHLKVENTNHRSPKRGGSTTYRVNQHHRSQYRNFTYKQSSKHSVTEGNAKTFAGYGGSQSRNTSPSPQIIATKRPRTEIVTMSRSRAPSGKESSKEVPSAVHKPSQRPSRRRGDDWKVRAAARRAARRRRLKYKKTPAYRQRYVQGRGRTKCVDRHPACHAWISRCGRTAAVTLSCPMTCGKCKGRRSRTPTRMSSYHKARMSRNPTGYHGTRQTKITARAASFRQRRHKNVSNLQELRTPRTYQRRPDRRVGRKSRRPRPSSYSRSYRRYSNNNGGCRDDPKHVKSCKFWAKRGICSNNQLISTTYCRYSCASCG